MNGALVSDASLRAISVFPTPVGPIMMIFFGDTSCLSPSANCCRLHRLRMATATARFASPWPMMYLSNSATIWRGVSVCIKPQIVASALATVYSPESDSPPASLENAESAEIESLFLGALRVLRGETIPFRAKSGYNPRMPATEEESAKRSRHSKSVSSLRGSTTTPASATAPSAAPERSRPSPSNPPSASEKKSGKNSPKKAT